MILEGIRIDFENYRVNIRQISPGGGKRKKIQLVVCFEGHEILRDKGSVVL